MNEREPKHGHVERLSEALERGAPPPGNLAIPIFSHGTLEAELYRPTGVDLQTPHTRDEVYVVARGTATFFDGASEHEVGAGDFLFVPAGREHRFRRFDADFAVWVFFYGPDGGEAPGSR